VRKITVLVSPVLTALSASMSETTVYELIFNIIRDEFDYTEVSKNSFLSHDVECISASENEDPEPEFVMPNKEEE